jgi:predicted transposase/invertase (TIGR01784 family)
MNETILSPKSDYIFKLIFGDERNIDVLQSFLQSVLDLPPEEYQKISIVDPHLKREDEFDKLAVLDVKVHTVSGKVIDVDIQVLDVPDIRERIALYTSKMVTEQISKGDEYAVIKRVICIVITDFILLEEEAGYHNVYRWRNIKSGNEFTNLIELNTLEIPKLPEQADKSELWDWMCFLKSKTKEEFEMVAKTNPQIGKAVGILMDLSADQRTRMIEEEREKGRRDWSSRMRGARMEGEKIGMKIGEQKGRQEGVQIGQQKLLDLLRSGKSPDEIIQMYDNHPPK